MGRPVASFQRYETGQSEPAGEEGGGGVEAAGEGWAVDL